MFEVKNEKNSRLTGRTKIVPVRVPLGDCAAIDNIVESAGSNVSAFIKEAITEKLQRIMSSGEGNGATVVG